MNYQNKLKIIIFDVKKWNNKKDEILETFNIF